MEAYDESSSTTQLLTQTEKWNEIIQTQSLRLQSLSKNVKDIFQSKRAVTKIQKDADMKENETNLLNKEYDDAKQKRNELERELSRIANKYNEAVEKENNLNAQKSLLQQKVMACQSHNELSVKCTDLVFQYQQFQANINKNIPILQRQTQMEWESVEQNWINWNVKDIICWLRYRLDWISQSSIPNDLDIAKIEASMNDNDVCGKSLHSMDKIDLFSYGFTKVYVLKIFPFIMSLRKKYPYDLKAASKEGMVEDTYSVGIPEKYKCKITKAIMSDPVIAFDGATYERQAILSYLRTHQKSPITGENCPMVNDDDYDLVLFADLPLQNEIEQFKQKNDVF